MSYDTYKPGNVHHFLGVDGTRKMFLASHKIANNHEFINLVLLQLKDHLELEMYRTNTTEELWKVLLSLPKLFAQFDNTGVNITDEFEVLIGLNEEHITSECITIILS